MESVQLPRTTRNILVLTSAPVSFNFLLCTDDLRVVEPHYSIEEALAQYDVGHTADVEIISDFIRQCLRLNPAERPTAEELSRHEWIRYGIMNLRYRDP